MRYSLSISAALFAGTAGALLAVPAAAQDYGYGAVVYGPPADEEVIVTAPPSVFREQGSGLRSLTLPPEKVSLSRAVHYGDLDLASWQGANELRHRVVATAQQVCGELRDAYPFERLSTSNSCFRDAMENGLLRADEAIADAQFRYGYRYGYGYEPY
jgi:UrcA family protein